MLFSKGNEMIKVENVFSNHLSQFYRACCEKIFMKAFCYYKIATHSVTEQLPLVEPKVSYSYLLTRDMSLRSFDKGLV